MGIGQWMRVLDAVGGFVELSSKFRRRAPEEEPLTATGARPGGLETRLAGVLVAALKEAFDRDSARLDLERSQIEGERQRAEQALRAELRRQAAERALTHTRLIAMLAVGVWALSAALGVWLPGMRETIPRTLLGLGWAASFAALGCAFAAWRSILTWSPDAAGEGKEPLTATLAPWLLVAALTLVGASLLSGL
jgi:hypothetical protein